MPKAAEAGVRDAPLVQLLTAAEEQVERWEAEPDALNRTERLFQASLLTQLAAALLLEPDLPAGPQGLEQRQDRERARRAVRFLRVQQEHRTGALSREVPDLAPPRRVQPRTEADEQLAVQTTTTLRDLQQVQFDLLCGYLDFACRGETARLDSTVLEATRGLLLGYWPSQRRLLRIKREHPTKQTRRPKSGIIAELHRPTWQNEVSREFRYSLDPDFLFWSNPLPSADSPPRSQES